MPLPHSAAYSFVGCCSSSRNLTAKIRAERTMSSGCMESICCSETPSSMVPNDGGRRCKVNGQPFRHCNANLVFRESRMHTASAIVSRGRSARVRIAWTSGTKGFVKEVEEGIRFVRWIAGPACNICN